MAMMTQRPPLDEIAADEPELEIDETDLVPEDDTPDTSPVFGAANAQPAATGAAVVGEQRMGTTDDTSFVEVLEVTDADVVTADELAVASFDPTSSIEEELTDDDLFSDDGGIDWSDARPASEPFNVWWKCLTPDVAFSLDDDDDDEPLLVEIEQGELSAYRRSTGGLSDFGGEEAGPKRRDLIWSSDRAPTEDVKVVLEGAASLLEKGRREDAALQVAIATRLSPLDLEIQERAKNLYLQLGMPASAVERLIHLAILAFESGARARALGYAEEALALSPDNRGVMRLVERLV
jgi:hypothetical protein